MNKRRAERLKKIKEKKSSIAIFRSNMTGCDAEQVKSAASTAGGSVPSAGDDFYGHVNDAWMSDPENCIPDEYSLWGGFTKLHDEGLKKQIAIVEALVESDPASLSDEERKIAAIWHASMNLRFKAWEEGKGDLSELVKELRVLDEYLPDKLADGDDDGALVDAIAKYFWYTQISGIRNVLDLDKGSDLKNVNNVILDLSACGLSLPSREYYTEENFEEKRTLFKTHLNNVKMLVESSGFHLGDTFVDDVVAYEHSIASFSMKRAHAREYHRYYTNTTLEDVASSKINELKYLDEKEEYYEEDDRKFEFSDSGIERVSRFFNAIYEASNIKSILEKNMEKNFTSKNVADPPSVHQITTYDGDGIRRTIRKLLDASSFSQYKSFMKYKIATRLSSFCTKAYDEEFFDFYSRKLRGQAEQKSNTKRSIAVVNQYAGEMNGKIFVSRYFSEDSKENVKTMIAQVLKIMETSLRKNDWLTESTKEKALQKLSKFRVKIGKCLLQKILSGFMLTMVWSRLPRCLERLQRIHAQHRRLSLRHIQKGNCMEIENGFFRENQQRTGP